MSCDCDDCCAGVRPRTPVSYNPPGRTALDYRIGTYGSFVESMRARVASRTPLDRLTTRDSDDPAIALLDCFAVIGDVLSFYQERIANEGYLRTATDPRSLAELGRLVGYVPRPALGSSTYLAFTLDPGSTTVIPVGSGVRSVPEQDELPQTFETAAELVARAEWNALTPADTTPPALRFYDNRSDPDDATEPDDVRTVPVITVAGTAANLTAGSRLLFLFGADLDTAVRVVRAAEPDFQAGRTTVSLVPDRDPLEQAQRVLDAAVRAARVPLPLAPFAVEVDENYLAQLDPDRADAATLGLAHVLDRLVESGAFAAVHETCTVRRWFEVQVRVVVEAGRRVVELTGIRDGAVPADITAERWRAHAELCPGSGTLAGGGRVGNGDGTDDCDAGAALASLTPMLPWLRRPPSRPPRRAREAAIAVPDLYRPDSDVHPTLLQAADPRLAGRLHGAWANERLTAPVSVNGLQVMRTKARLANITRVGEVAITGYEVWLDAVYDGILPGSWVIIAAAPFADRVVDVREDVRDVSIPGSEETVQVPSTVLGLGIEDLDRWLTEHGGDGQVKPGSPVWAQGEALTLLGDPITADVAGIELELAGVVDGLRPGRWIVVAGERTDVPHTSGVAAAELAMIAGIRQWVAPDRPGSAVRTFLRLTDELAYRYRRDTVVIHGNVVAATQGETRREILGGGDASVGGQTFRLRQVSADNPLTALPADNPAGFEDTLEVAIAGVRWHRAELLAAAAPTDHVYAAGAAADKTVDVRFGDGLHGARLPTGLENITATFRVGAGRPGNVGAGQVRQLVSRPLGVASVTNPLPATGGVDGDGPSDARTSTPLRLLALDRLVSVRDYEDFTLARAGIGKARARGLFDGSRGVVHVTVAGIDDAPIDPQSELFGSLEDTLRRFGDAGVPVRLAVREQVLLILSAGIRIDPDYSWDLVEPAVRAAVLAAFSFERAELGRSVYRSEAIAVMQAVSGVDYVDVDVFHGIPGTVTPIELVTLANRLATARGRIPVLPARFTEERVPVDGDDLTSFARRVGLTVTEVVRLNPWLTDVDIDSAAALTVFRGIRPDQLAVLPAGVPEALTLRRIP